MKKHETKTNRLDFGFDLFSCCFVFFRGLNFFFFHFVNPFRLSGIYQSMRGDGENDNRAADDRPAARTLAQNQEHPDRIEKRFDETDDARVERAHAFGDSFREQNVSDADLKYAQKQNRQNIFGGHRRKIIVPNERQHQQHDKDIAVKNRQRGIRIFERARMSEQNKIQTEKNSRSERGEIAEKNVRREIVRRAAVFEKKQAHSRQTQNDGYQIGDAKFFLQDKRRENQNINRCRVLQKNRVRGGRRFVGVNKTA